MFKIISILLFTITSQYIIFSQYSEGVNYQAILRDGGNVVLTNCAVSVKFIIQEGSIGGLSVYDEIFQTTTNSYGLINLKIGSGTTNSNFSLINWANGPYFLETSIDLSSNNQWVIMGTSQLLSVPYAFHSNTTDSLIGGINGLESDPIFLSSVSAGITSSDTAKWNNYIDTNTQLDSTGIANLGFVAGPKTVDTDTQLDSTGIANLGFVAGPKTIDTDTQLDSTGIANLGFVAGSHPIDTDTQLDSTGIANLGFVGEKIYSIGMYPELGGYVFRISADGKHGLVAETQDQSSSPTIWYGCDNFINNPNNHSVDGQQFCNWRLPSKNELNEMYLHRLSIGGNFNLRYWSSTQFSQAKAYSQDFSSTGNGTTSMDNKFSITPINYVRGLREF